MLVLSRKVGETIRIGDNVTISVVKISGNRVRIGIEAPDDVDVLRGELRPKTESRPRSWEADLPIAPAPVVLPIAEDCCI